MSQDILAELKDQVEAMKAQHGRAPGLATILIGDNPASVSYVSRKVRTALKLGFHEVQQTLPASTSQQDLLSLVEQYNQDPHIDGILVQLPLPDSICEQAVVHAIDPSKDVDGFHPVNLGRMMQGERDTCYLPCTPAGIQEMLVRSGTQTRGAEVVVVGRSAIVGRPVATLLGQKGTGANSTVDSGAYGHPRSGQPLPACRHTGGSRRCARPCSAGLDQAGRHRYRCGRQSDRCLRADRQGPALR